MCDTCPMQHDVHVCSNGFTAVVAPQKAFPLVSLQVWIETGSIHEGEHLGAGLSHLLEHMVFKGTHKRTARQIAEEAEVLQEGEKVTLLALGSMVHVAEDAAARLQEETGIVPTVINALKAHLAELPEWNAEDVKKIFKTISKETGLKGKKVFMPIRVALTGQMHGPDLHFIIPVLGPELVAKRLQKTVNL